MFSNDINKEGIGGARAEGRRGGGNKRDKTAPSQRIRSEMAHLEQFWLPSRVTWSPGENIPN